jgi:hypothetical protein
MEQIMLPDWGRGGNNYTLPVLEATQSEVLAIMTRIRVCIVDPKSAFKKISYVIEEEFQGTFNRMLVMSLIFNTDLKRELSATLIKDSAQQSVKDVKKELDKLVEKKKIGKAEVQIIENILKNDPTISEELKNTQFGLSSAITRHANQFHATNDSKYNQLQEIGRNVLEVLPTVNYGGRGKNPRRNTY